MNRYKKNNASLITIEGHLEHITYFNEETQYTIARLKTPHPAAGVTVVGYLAGVSPGEAIKVKGTWQTHPKYGQQFKIYSYEVTLPAAVEGIDKSSGGVHLCQVNGSADDRWLRGWRQLHHLPRRVNYAASAVELALHIPDCLYAALVRGAYPDTVF